MFDDIVALKSQVAWEARQKSGTRIDINSFTPRKVMPVEGLAKKKTSRKKDELDIDGDDDYSQETSFVGADKNKKKVDTTLLKKHHLEMSKVEKEITQLVNERVQRLSPKGSSRSSSINSGASARGSARIAKKAKR